MGNMTCLECWVEGSAAGIDRFCYMGNLESDHEAIDKFLKAVGAKKGFDPKKTILINNKDWYKYNCSADQAIATARSLF